MINDVRLQKFRSYSDGSFEFGQGVNIIVGPNASGKTNLLEALLLVARGSSYRVKDVDLLQFEADWSRIDSRVGQGERTVKLELTNPEKVKKTLVIDGKKYATLGLKESIPIVLFEPNHLQYISGSPGLRREFIDTILEQTEASFSDIKKRYNRTLLQRNTLLKKPHTTSDQFFVWNVRLAEFGGIIAEARQKLIQKINLQSNQVYSGFSGDAQILKLAYNVPEGRQLYATTMLRHLEQNITKDSLRGFTSFGPHREDIDISLNDQAVQLSASRGEARSILLTLKIIEAQILEEQRGQKPIFLLDDVFSELDGARRQALTQILNNHQVFITTTDADVVVQHFMDNCTIIPLDR